MTVQVRAGLGEQRLTAAVHDVFARHHELRKSGTTCDVRRTSTQGLTGKALADRTAVEINAATQEQEQNTALFKVLWLDAGPENSGKLVLLMHRQAMAALPWHVLLSELVSAWNKGNVDPVAQQPKASV